MKHKIERFFSFYLKKEKIFSIYIKKVLFLWTRFALGIIYFWYGLLKVLGISPIDELVYKSVHWIVPYKFVTILGFWEMIIGIGFMIKKLNRLALVLFFLQIPGTFLPLFTNPEDCFTIIPYGLTLEGQYIFKNLITIAAALVVIASLHEEENLQKSFKKTAKKLLKRSK